MPSCTRSRLYTKKVGGGLKGGNELVAALEFLFAIVEQQDKRPSPTVEEFMASAKAVFKGSSVTKDHKSRKSTRGSTHQTRGSKLKHTQKGSGSSSGSSGSHSKVHRFIRRLLETQGSFDTPCNSFFAHLNVVLLAVTLYSFVAAIMEVYPTMSPPPTSITSALSLAAAAAHRPVFVNSIADPVRWFVVQTVPGVQTQIDDLYIQLQRMIQVLIEITSSATVTAESMTAFGIGLALLFYFRQMVVAPFVFRQVLQRPLACVLERMGVLSCREHCYDTLRRLSVVEEDKEDPDRKDDKGGDVGKATKSKKIN